MMGLPGVSPLLLPLSGLQHSTDRPLAFVLPDPPGGVTGSVWTFSGQDKFPSPPPETSCFPVIFYRGAFISFLIAIPLGIPALDGWPPPAEGGLSSPHGRQLLSGFPTIDNTEEYLRGAPQVMCCFTSKKPDRQVKI